MTTKFALRSAIEGEERLQRMRENMRRQVGRLTPQPARPGTLAIVGYGPSLRASWPEISTQHVCTTSGAHDFLIARGITPTWHVEFDPRPHKAEMLNRPLLDTTYCLASTCNKNLFDKLTFHKVLLWHAMGSEPSEDCEAVCQEESDDGILLVGGSNAGLRALSVGYTLGFRRFDLFGLDCSYADDGATWAGEHTGKPHSKLKVECDGKQFFTSDVMINAAEELFDWLGRVKDCEVRIFGESLFAARMKLFQRDPERGRSRWWKPVDFELARAPIFPNVQETKKLISPSYRKLNRKLHEKDQTYGSYSGKHAKQVLQFADLMLTRDILDYGCGKRGLEKALGFAIKNYDPAIPGCDKTPEPSDIVVCTDVLEHIEMASLGAVLDDLKRVTKRVVILEISTVAANKALPDGRNTHQIIQPPNWWLTQLAHWFDFIWPPFFLNGVLKGVAVPKLDEKP